jgi:outer membrane protein OmpA-like peptidoglycan-associated protein
MVQIKPKVQILKKVPESKKSNFLIPLIIISLLVIIIGGYFFLKPSSESKKDGSSQSIEKEDKTIVSDVQPQGQIQTAVNEKIASTKSSEEAISQNQTNIQADKNKKNESTQQNETKPIIELPYKKGEAYKVYQFPFGVADYSQPNPELDKLVTILKENANVKITIFAYTDKVGNVDRNQLLSERRAKAIYDYLINNGINKSRLTYQGKGISTRYASDAENRRAEFILTE